MINMATDLAIPEFFSIGSLISCKTCTNKEVEGEVLAWDPTKKVLIIKSESMTRSNHSDIQIVNLDFVSEVKVKKDNSSSGQQSPCSLNVQRLKDRAEEQIRLKNQLVSALKAGVSPEGQRLFTAIKKTIEEVSWRNEDIIVMDKVCVTKPYTPDCVKPLNEKVKEEKKAIDHVRKIVEKHIQDRDEGKIHQRGN